MEHTPNGRQLRDQGIARAVNHADTETPLWSDQAFEFLQKYIRDHDSFMAEDVRVASTGIVPEPPHNRAWGGVIVRAVRAGLIVSTGFQSVKSPKGHCGICNVWGVL